MVAALLSLVSAEGRPVVTQAGNQSALLIEEYGDINYEDEIARLDNFAIELQNEPNAKAYIIIYRSRRDPPGLNHRHGFMMKHYLVDIRGINPERIVIVEGGARSCMSVELWHLPAGAASPPLKGTYNSHTDITATFKYDEHDYLLPIDPILYDEYNSEGKGVAPELLGGFAAALKKRPDARAFVIAYEQYCREVCSPDTLLDRRGTAEKMLRHEKEILTGRYGIESSRIVTVKGGYRRYRKIELWIVPKGADKPVPSPTVIPPRHRKI